MGTHFHLVVKTPEPNLYWGMQRWLSPYATEFHRRHGTHGHVFERPFGSARIKDDRQLKTTIRYVVWNPVEAKMCRTPEEHVWGSHRHVLNGTRDPLVNAEELLGYFGANGGDPLATYADFTTVA
jgi:hypothetical protein